MKSSGEGVGHAPWARASFLTSSDTGARPLQELASIFNFNIFVIKRWKILEIECKTENSILVTLIRIKCGLVSVQNDCEANSILTS